MTTYTVYYSLKGKPSNVSLVRARAGEDAVRKVLENVEGASVYLTQKTRLLDLVKKTKVEPW